MALLTTITRAHNSVAGLLNRYLEPIALLLMRLTVAHVFLTSGLAKWQSFGKFDTTSYDLFLYEFFCPDPVREGALLLCNPETLDYDSDLMIRLVELMALAAGIMEVVLPLLLIAGLFSRYAALGLLAMTLFIQFAVFPSWDHWVNPASWWAVTLLMIVARGAGSLSLDRLGKRWGERRET